MPTAPEPSSNPATRKVGPFPLWVWVVGVGGVAIVLYRRRASAANAQQQLLPTPIGGAVDPSTGLPINPIGGMPFTTSQPTTVGMTLNEWVTAAFKALTGANVSPALANQALYDYSQGNPLSTGEAGAINRALGLVGMPPVTLPFFGPIPATPGAPGTPKPAGQVYVTTNKIAGPTRQFIPGTGNVESAAFVAAHGGKGNTLVDLLLWSGLIRKAAGGYVTTPKFGGPARAFNPWRSSVGQLTALLQRQGIITPINIPAAA